MNRARKIHGFCLHNGVFARVGTIPKPQPNRANTSFYEAKPCNLQCFVCFYTIFVFFEGPGGPRAAPGAPQGVPEALRTLQGGPNGPPGVLLERSWCPMKRSRDALDGSWRLLAAPRALPGRFWRSPGALLGPFGALGLHSRAFFLPENCLFWRSAPPHPKPQPPLGL